MTQEQVAEALNISPVTLSRWINGPQSPSFAKIDRLARELGRPILMTFGDDEKAPPPQWATGLEERVISEVRLNRDAITETLTSQADDFGRQLFELAALLPPLPTDEESHDGADRKARRQER